jgi:hypothetical protein
MEFKPSRWVMKWFGPLFRKRVFAFLLVFEAIEIGSLQGRSIVADQIHEQSGVHLRSITLVIVFNKIPFVELSPIPNPIHKFSKKF